MCQGLLPIRRHFEKREDPGDEVEGEPVDWTGGWKICGWVSQKVEGVGKDMEKWNPPAGWEEVSEKTGKSTQASFQ